MCGKIRSEYIRGTAQVGDKVRELRLKWFGLVQRRDRGYTGQRMSNMSCLEDTRSRVRWSQMIRCDDH